MSPTLLTTSACGHAETSSTRIGTGRVPGLRGVIRKLSCKTSPSIVIADSTALCSTCRKDVPTLPPINFHKCGKSVRFEKSTEGKDERECVELDLDPLRCHPIIPALKAEELDETFADPYVNEFAELPKYGAHNFTRKHPDDLDEGSYHREAMPITPVLSPSEPISFPETEFFLPESMLSFEVAGQPSETESIMRAIEKKSKD